MFHISKGISNRYSISKYSNYQLKLIVWWTSLKWKFYLRSDPLIFFCKPQQIDIKGQTINFIKTGTGENAVLCFPGALGTIWSDFKPQIENLDKSKFTVVAFDPPGYGYSRPPSRNFSADFYEKDADAAYNLMKVFQLIVG